MTKLFHFENKYCPWVTWVAIHWATHHTLLICELSIPVSEVDVISFNYHNQKCSWCVLTWSTNDIQLQLVWTRRNYSLLWLHNGPDTPWHSWLWCSPWWREDKLRTQFLACVFTSFSSWLPVYLPKLLKHFDRNSQGASCWGHGSDSSPTAARAKRNSLKTRP